MLWLYVFVAVYAAGIVVVRLRHGATRPLPPGVAAFVLLLAAQTGLLALVAMPICFVWETPVYDAVSLAGFCLLLAYTVRLAGLQGLKPLSRQARMLLVGVGVFGALLFGSFLAVEGTLAGGSTALIWSLAGALALGTLAAIALAISPRWEPSRSAELRAAPLAFLVVSFVVALAGQGGYYYVRSQCAMFSPAGFLGRVAWFVAVLVFVVGMFVVFCWRGGNLARVLGVCGFGTLAAVYLWASRAGHGDGFASTLFFQVPAVLPVALGGWVGVLGFLFFAMPAEGARVHVRPGRLRVSRLRLIGLASIIAGGIACGWHIQQFSRAGVSVWIEGPAPEIGFLPGGLLILVGLIALIEG